MYVVIYHINFKLNYVIFTYVVYGRRLNTSNCLTTKRAGDTHPEIGKAKETRDTSIRTCPVKPTRKKNKHHSMRNLLGVLKP